MLIRIKQDTFFIGFVNKGPLLIFVRFDLIPYKSHPLASGIRPVFIKPAYIENANYTGRTVTMVFEKEALPPIGSVRQTSLMTGSIAKSALVQSPPARR